MSNTIYFGTSRQPGIRILLLLSWAFLMFQVNVAIASTDDSLQHEVAVIYSPFGDSMFTVKSRAGAFSMEERAQRISRKVENLIEDDFFSPDSLQIRQEGTASAIVYNGEIIVFFSESDAAPESSLELATNVRKQLLTHIGKAKSEQGGTKLLFRLAQTLLVIIGAWLIFVLVRMLYRKTLLKLSQNQKSIFKELKFRNYTFLTVRQEYRAARLIINIIRYILLGVIFYFMLPLVFSIFPQTRRFTDYLLHWIWSPFRTVLSGVWNYLPDLFSVLVIVFIMHHIMRVIKYFFDEIRNEKLKINGFDPDWAMPTYGLARVLMIAFTIVLIFPHLPGSDSDAFKGVSVFLGVLFSLGSTSAISNIIAGLVIIYMRPFKVGDRIKIDDTIGDVIERSMLVTRIKTPKNEEITIPNASVLSGKTVNYSTFSKDQGLILNTTVTIGYDVAWKEMHEALIEAALRTEFVAKSPSPFVLQTALNDFYVSYQVNVYTAEASKQATMYSELHRHIQDVCNERGIEIMSPHYIAARDGNTVAYPEQYRKPGYEPPGFIVQQRNTDKGNHPAA